MRFKYIHMIDNEYNLLTLYQRLTITIKNILCFCFFSLFLQRTHFKISLNLLNLYILRYK